MSINIARCKASSLPFEILSRIFQFLSKESLSVCLHVCRSWYYPSGQLFFQTICIKDDNKDNSRQRSKERVCMLIKTIKCYSQLHLDFMIQSIHIQERALASSLISKEDFQELLMLCRNLQELAMNVNSIYWRYLYEMMSPSCCDMPTFSIRRLLPLSPASSNVYRDNFFYKVAHQHRRTLTELIIGCASDPSIYADFGSLFDYLAEFPKLQQLSIVSGNSQRFIYFHQLLETCKKLKRLSFQLDHPFFEKLDLDDSKCTPFSLYPTLIELDLFLPHFSAESLRYIMTRFVLLKRLTLRINQDDMRQEDSWGNTDIYAKRQDAIWFFKHDFMHFIRRLEFSDICIQISRTSYVEDLIARYYFIPYDNNKTRSNKTATMQASFTVYDGRAERTEISLRQERSRIQINYTFIRSLSVHHNQQQSNFVTPYMPYLQSYGSFFNDLKIMHTIQVEREQIVDIDHILFLCPNLVHLSIVVDLYPMIYFFNELLDSQTLHHRSISTHAAFNVQRDRYDKLKFLQLKGMRISPSFVSRLVQKCPNLKELHLTECTSNITHLVSETLQRSINGTLICYNLSTYDLAVFVFDIAAYYIRNRENISQAIFIAIERIDVNSCEYYVARRPFNQSISIDFFQKISPSMFNNFEKEIPNDTNVVRLWFTFRSLTTLELRGGRNLNNVKSITFPR
ncbi:MAG: hypothetical protein EXX96DRAFT_560871 [Benjaminiella poitrasii]|nr:MAG: hypothetical protein EXX96DRAFT_560871 [Benjaminiella poitrasii]